MENSWKKKEKQTVLMKSSQNQIQIQIQNQQLRKLSKTPYPPAQVEEEEEEEVKVAAVGISLNIRLRSADMPQSMQQHAFRYTASLLHDHSSCPTPSLLARALKKEFDSSYGLLWHCIVGKSFGSFVTHSKGGFLYFSLDSHNLSFLLFKTEVQLVT